MNNVNDILSTGSGKEGRKPLSEEQLLAYLEGKLPPSEQYEVEQWLAEEGMESDAVEGLSMIKPEETRQMVTNLNYTLNKTLVSKKKKRRPPLSSQYTLIAIIITLLLAAVAFAIIKLIK